MTALHLFTARGFPGASDCLRGLNSQAHKICWVLPGVADNASGKNLRSTSPSRKFLYISDREKVDRHQKSFRSRNGNIPYFLRRTQLISTMKLLILVLALSCAIVYTSADLWKPEPLPTNPILSHNPRSHDQAEKDFGVTDGFRFRREAKPQRGSINFQGTQPLSGPNRQPTWDLNANRNILNNGRTTADVYGGLNKVPGQRVQPHFGVQAERNFGNNGFIRGHTQFQPRPGGHGLSPSVGVTGGFRFRREAEPQGGSINFQGTQPLSGPNRQPSWDLNANRNIYNNGRTTADVYGGLNKVPGQRVQPHFGVQAERNFGNNGFIRGHTQFQPRPGGHGLSPSVGVTGGFRFRREAEPQGGSINFQGTQPLSGPNRQPSWDLNANRNIYNNGRTTMDVYGGLNKVPGQRVQPHVGVQAERNFGNNGFIRGHTQFQPRPGGHGLSPSVGVTGGFRFRRAAEDTDEAVSAEE